MFGESRDEWGVPKRPNEKLVVEKLFTKDCIRRIRSTLSPAGYDSSILAGNLDAMEATRQCWSVEVDHGIYRRSSSLLRPKW